MGRIMGDSEWERAMKPWMLNEYINGSLENMKNRALEFKRTRDPKLFSLLLFRFDHFVIYVCSKFRRRFSFLADVPMEDIYHTAILATYKSFISMPDTWRTDQLLLRISSYIKSELFTWFNDRVALKSDRLEPYDLECLETTSAQDLEDQINCSLILDSLTAEDRILIDRKLMQATTYKDLGKEYGGISKQAICKRVNKILKKIRSVVDK
jgi:hypothetical protein